MARRNRPRDVGAADRLAANVKGLREARGWTPESLAHRMTASGCPIAVSAIYKIEKEGRSVDPDELVTFAALFEVSTDDLLSAAPWDALPPELKKIIADCQSSVFTLSTLQEALEQAKTELDEHELSMAMANVEIRQLPARTRQRLLESQRMPAFFRDALSGPVNRK